MAVSSPSEKREKLIHQNLEMNRWYISRNLDWKDLVMHYHAFTKDEVHKLRMKARTDEGAVVQQALDMIIDKTHKKNRFSVLLEALREAEYPKLADILEGKGVVIHDRHRKVLKDCAKNISEWLNPDDILHYLAARDVLSSKDVEYIKNKGRMDGRANAVFELIQFLPSRNTKWFSTFIQILKENSYECLAIILEMRAATSIQNGRPTVQSMLPAQSSLNDSPSVQLTRYGSPPAQSSLNDSPSVKLTRYGSPPAQSSPNDRPSVQSWLYRSSTTQYNSPSVQPRLYRSLPAKSTPNDSPSVQPTLYGSPPTQYNSPSVQPRLYRSLPAKLTPNDSPSVQPIPYWRSPAKLFPNDSPSVQPTQDWSSYVAIKAVADWSRQ